MSSAYSESGVNIDAGNRAVELMRDAVRATYNKNILAGIGAFGGLFDASELKNMRAPVLVASTDGVGTKVKIAAQARHLENIGRDLVNHCINDILVQGAQPLFFMDYIASSKLIPENVAAIVTSMAEACREANIALLGGETAEMPGVYLENEFDVAGTIVGIVERENILPKNNLRAGDVLIGLKSNGLHTNGYSLARKIFQDVPLDTVFPELGEPLQNILLAPHRSYLRALEKFIAQSSPIKALAHITGGGIVENLPRVLPENLSAHIELGSWQIPPLFQLIQQRGEIPTAEMFRVFNMGIGMLAIVAKEDAREFQKDLSEESFLIGELETGDWRLRISNL
ncbi:MAG: phosphoribosylformylglycinamidine cyclo-ligase [Chloroflexi bacterium UTCFX4]|jgi:phosphoribosylformylglycinamidine cyclo-ligase/phosphoribosylamine--glycine ligase/phosphoribosylformylglycinamidine cyclo-ligase|nr:MAG: phosphoribosylformylglycinamidine cyclo-ligase [Chloroflexi bacterium UTCFX4]